MSSGKAKFGPGGAQQRGNFPPYQQSARQVVQQAGPQQRRAGAQPQHAARAKPSPRADADQLAIPMSKVNPLWIALAVVAVVAVVGTVVFATRGASSSDGKKSDRPAATWVTRDELEARRRHLEITRKSLDDLPLAEEASQAKGASSRPKPRPRAARAGSATAPVRAAAAPAPAAPAPAPAPPPKPKTTKAQKKQIDTLDNIANDIASQLE